MSLLQSDKLTLKELSNRTDDGNVQAVADVIDETNEFVSDAMWLQGNQPDGHKGTIRHSLPTGTWRQVNDGIEPESSKTKQITEGIGTLEALSKVDKELADKANNPQQFRALEDEAFLEGMSQNFASTFIYGNTDEDPTQFDGLAPRLNKLDYGNVYNNGGSGDDLTSIYVVQWGPRKTHFIYPKNGEPGGISAEDLGEQLVDGQNKGEYRAYVTHFAIKVGLFVHDDRCIRRIANIETPDSESNSFDEDLLLRALRDLPNGGQGAVILANSDVLTEMDIRAKDKSNVNYSTQEVFGVPTTTFRGTPVRQVDAILSTESEIT